MAQINKPTDYFNTKLYTGNGSSSSREITTNSQVDWLWIKNRGTTDSHVLEDNVRGAGKTLFSNLSNAESTLNRITALGTNSFTFATNNSSLNASSNNYVAWHWRAGGTASSNTDVDITSSVSANTTAGFSISTFTVSGSGNIGVGHGLGEKPKLVITKSTSNSTNWNVYHEDTSASPENDYLFLNATNAKASLTDVWGDGMTTTTFGLGVGIGVSVGRTYVAYCFAEKKGFSKFGSYTGNGSTDGTFIYTGFKPAWIMLKCSSSAGTNWFIQDNKRNPYNVVDKYLNADSTAVDSTADLFDITSNGFKQRNNFPNLNGSGSTYIYMAFAEEPLVGTNNIPSTAR